MDDFTGDSISAAMSGSSGDATPADTSTTATPAPETATATTGTGTTPPAAVSTPAKPQGPIPFDVHTRSMDNARAKAVEEYRAKHGWAETADKATYDQAAAIAKRVQTDPIGYARELIAELHAHPQHGPALRSELARQLAAGRAAPTMPEPDVAITDANGNVVGQTYSATQLAKRDEWLKSSMMADIRKEYEPIVQAHKTTQEERQLEKEKLDGDQFASGLMTEAKDLPHFQDKEIQKAIGVEVIRIVSTYDQQHPDQLSLPEKQRRSSQPEFLEAAFHRAYNRIVVPKLDASARQAVAADLATKGTVSGVTPGKTAVGAPRNAKTGQFTGADLAAEFARRKVG